MAMPLGVLEFLKRYFSGMYDVILASNNSQATSESHRKYLYIIELADSVRIFLFRNLLN